VYFTVQFLAGTSILELYVRWKLKNILHLGQIVAYVVTASSLYILPILRLTVIFQLDAI